MKIQKFAIPVILTLVTGCSFIPRMTEPYETRYFTKSNVQSLNSGYLESNEDFNKQCKGVRFFSSLGETEKNIIVMLGPNLSEIDTKTPYHIVAKKGDDRYLVSDSGRYLVRLPATTLEKCTVTEDVYKSNAEKESKKAIDKKEAVKKEAAEKERKAKQEIEKTVAELNDGVIKKYGKPFCIPFTSKNIIPNPVEIGGGFNPQERKKKDCLFIGNFSIRQVTEDGMLVTSNGEDTYFVIKNKDDADKIDGDVIRDGLFEYVGNSSYESLRGTKTVLKFKHVK